MGALGEPLLDFAPRVRRRVLGGSLSQTERSPAQFVGRAVGLPEGVIDGQDEAVPLEMLGAGAGVIDRVVHQVGEASVYATVAIDGIREALYGPTPLDMVARGGRCQATKRH